MELLEQTYLGNPVSAYLTSLIVLVAGIAAVRIIETILLRGLKKQAKQTETTLDDFLIKLIERKLLPMFYFGILYISIQNLVISASVSKAINVTGIALVTFLAVRLCIAVIYYSFERYWALKQDDASRVSNFRRLLPVVKFLVWTIGILFLLDNLGFKITTVVAGLGIGGIAVALAAQAVLGDLLSYFAILLDKPFELGDFIIVDDMMGTVEHVGIKTTRIRSLGGEQLVFSNTDLTGSRVKNYKRMEQRRVVFTLGVIYQTSIEKLREIPGIIEEAIKAIPETRFDRCHFFSFGASSLDVETVYYVLTGDYAKYMDIQQKVNFAVMEEFEKRGIEFAYPTQTIFLEKGE